MIKNNKLRIPKMPHSIDSAANVLGVDKDNLITWILDGSIRACINYRTFYSDSLTYTAAVINSTPKIKEEYKIFLNDADKVDCPLSGLLSTPYSIVSINPHSVSVDKQGSEISFSADLKGLWHISCLDDLAELYDGLSGGKIPVMIVPYIANDIYSSYINEEMDDFITGFEIDISFNEICISYEDLLRIFNYLNHDNELKNLNNEFLCEDVIKARKIFPPSETANMILVQVLQAYCPFYQDLLDEPRGALAKLEKDFIKKAQEDKFRTLTPPRISESTLSRMIIKGKEVLYKN